MTLGKRLKALRGKRTQQDIADLLDIARARYSHYENDHVQPDNDLLQKMADIYGVTVDFLLGRSGEGNDPVYILSEDDIKILNGFKKLNEKDQDYILNLIERLEPSNETKKE